MVKAPARDPSDFGIARRAEATLFIPEKAKCTSAPKRFLHMGCFAFFEVSLIGRVVGVRVSFDFNVSLDGGATGGPQPNLNRLALVITNRSTLRRVVVVTGASSVKRVNPYGVALIYAGLGSVDPCCPRKSSSGSQKHNGKLRPKQDLEIQAGCFPSLNH
jgi:hypothetical protein